MDAEPLEVLYEDTHLLFVNKPAGLLTQPTAEVADSAEERAKHYLKIKYQKSGNVYLHAIHRLDRPASGIVLFAKSSKALSRLNEALRNKHIHKWYLAICTGIFEKKAGVMTHFLVHDDHKASVSSSESAGGKKSELEYEVLKSENGLNLVGIHLITGRYHQIRAQLAYSAHPIIGDGKYGSKYPYNNEGIALHHYKMQIPHPITKEIISIESQTPSFWPLNHKNMKKP